ncbi:MAG: ferrous iron transport protein B [Planctomycetales bacterium]|nr:ferrous iron transport protein B [Planctomycetales bacterium]NIM09598.1 ferrous iron transport protein B [Planctomycetales bacterium]NIN09087.1 ferrous iron transport protein B [Planctomycetales bacterium]NIN78197.1 ferrous iron transport protein B [Planctomycetales bacterium]NIO35383.1 ferrous iron transport protein B [Planctomycetales bacterium]
MSISTRKDTLRIAMVGNPNTGKSTLFNALSGMRQRVGNYPGVTVETKTGSLTLNGCTVQLVDLPGTYSLAPQSPDEMVAIDVLLGCRGCEPADMVIVIVDASNLERNLYLVSQVLELRRPTLLALNMTDIARSRGLVLDVELLEKQLQIPVVPIQANRRLGLDRLKSRIESLCENGGVAVVGDPLAGTGSVFPEPFQDELAGLAELLADRPLPRYLVERLLLDCGGYLEHELLADRSPDVHAQLAAARRRLAEAGHAVPGVEAQARYAWVDRVLEGVVTRPDRRMQTWSDRIDAVLTHKLGGTLIFLVLMMVVFQSVFRWAEPLMGWTEAAMALVGDLAGAALAAGALRSLIVDGVVAGVGSVLVFLPQIFILFLFIALLEDCGYMARAAYLMDKLMVRAGLSGKSFIPLLSSFACAIPGIMATRVIENRRDRLTTILVAPLMSCSARLPVYTLLIAAFVPQTDYLGGIVTLPGLTLLAMYLLGILVAVAVALLLKRTLLKGETPPFVMELPSYKWPSLRVVLYRMFERGWAFVRRAGTLIFAVAIVVWAAAYYPHDTSRVDPLITQRLEQLDKQLAAATDAQKTEVEKWEQERDDLQNEQAGELLRHSFLGMAGQAIEPVVKPLGWDWRIGCAAIASFPAREVVVSTLGVIYNLGTDTDEESPALKNQLQAATWPHSGQPVFTLPVALSIMVFFALCAQCAATLVVIRRETGSWRWPLFTFVYMTLLAYIGALMTYQAGSWLMGA